ncbi:MAG: hypothetical protein QME05_05240, partial [Candidatus Margulisbacteria bacterium]|nr:hypothetical protein [Candidatus Margulisiibacteriota bacterium]
ANITVIISHLLKNGFLWQNQGQLATDKEYFDENGNKIGHGFMPYSGYRLDGSAEWTTITLQSLAGYMLFFWMSGDDASAEMISDKIQEQYNTAGYWGPTADEYYAQNWVWFAYQLMAHGPESLFGEVK